MKTYEFQLASYSGLVNVVITIDDNGDFAGIEYVGYDAEYDQTVAALYGKESGVSKLEEMIELPDNEKTSIIYGIKRSWNIPETTCVILSLTMSASNRLDVITVMSRREYHGYIRRFLDENTALLIQSLINQKLILRAILNDDYMNFPTMLDIFKSLDAISRYIFIDEVKTTRFRVSQMVELVTNEDEKSRRRMAHKITRNIRDFLTYDNTSTVVDCVMDLAETMKNDRNKANTIVDILIHTHGNIKPAPARRIGKILLGIDPVILRDIRDSIMMYDNIFEPALYGKLLSILR